MGFIAMKGMAGGLLSDSKAAMAYMTKFDNVLPIWGVQRDQELDEWLSFFQSTPEATDEMEAFFESERKELAGDFCRGCGYCLPCPKGIVINQCARISLMARRAPTEAWTTPHWQEEMERTKECTECRACVKKCPYGLDVPELLKKNYQDYQNILSREVSA